MTAADHAVVMHGTLFRCTVEERHMVVVLSNGWSAGRGWLGMRRFNGGRVAWGEAGSMTHLVDRSARTALCRPTRRRGTQQRVPVVLPPNVQSTSPAQTAQPKPKPSRSRSPGNRPAGAIRCAVPRDSSCKSSLRLRWLLCCSAALVGRSYRHTHLEARRPLRADVAKPSADQRLVDRQGRQNHRPRPPKPQQEPPVTAVKPCFWRKNHMI